MWVPCMKIKMEAKKSRDTVSPLSQNPKKNLGLANSWSSLRKRLISAKMREAFSKRALEVHTSCTRILYTDRKNPGKNWNFNEYLLMGWSHISLKCQRCMTFTPPHQQIFIDNSIFADFFLTVYFIPCSDGPWSLIYPCSNQALGSCVFLVLK